MKFKMFGKASALVVLSAVVAAMIAISYFGLLDHYELTALDLRFKMRPKPATTEKVVLIEIGEDTIKKLGRFPFPRSYHAILVRALSEFGARAIFFDTFFSEAENNDAEFAEAIGKAGNVYLPFAFDMEGAGRSAIPQARGYLAKSLDELTNAAKGAGHINIIPDPDGKFRRIPPVVRYGGKFYPYLSVLLACDYLGIARDEIKLIPGKFLVIRDMKIPLDKHSDMVINYSGRWGDVYYHYSYTDILQSYIALLTGQKPILDPAFFKDKICLVGLTATGTVDIHPNPFETLYPGVGIHAEIFNSIINRRFLAPVAKRTNLLILAILSLFTALVTTKMKPLRSLVFLICITTLFIISSILLFNIYGIVIDVIYPVFAIGMIYLSFTIYKYITELNRRLILENELGIAKKIQESFLPKRMPELGGISIAASMFTARQVGGDLYDFCEFGPDKLGVMIGDVSGKGVPASLFMAMVTGSFKFFASLNERPGEVLAKLNSKIVKESSSNLFVTIFYAVFDLKNKSCIYGNGGHLPVLYLSAEGKKQFLDVENGAPLGLLEGEYSTKEISFKKGDIFIFYTDGITEAMNSRREMYGNERLSAVIENNRVFSPQAILAAIEKDVRRFEPRSKQHDDMTAIVVKIT